MNNGVERKDDGGSTFNPVLLPMYERPTPLLGEKDIQNRYSSAVIVKTGQNSGNRRNCTGVLIAPRLVLTAAQCVCAKYNLPTVDGEEQSIIDNASCEEIATVVTVLLNPQQEQLDDTGIFDKTLRHYSGVVRPHPQLRILFNKDRAVTSANASLAIILLNKPVENKQFIARLSESVVKTSESVTVAGYQHNQGVGEGYGVRLVSESRVTKALASGREDMLLTEEDKSLFVGSEGSPCFRTSGRGTELIGIITGTLDKEAIMTSTFPYNDWLRLEISRAGVTDSGTP